MDVAGRVGADRGRRGDVFRAGDDEGGRLDAGELRAQVEEETNRNLYTLTMFSVIFLPATLIASIWGMNVGGVPFSGSPNGFWLVAGLIAAIFTLFAIDLDLLRFRFF